ncbi:uncharacterized protein Dmoj_GI10997 [Drosophila mojavensis]|uniref:BHLH domain-containing protein n=1 Tax=Drosophila mojavensis TaxID=7230 RepID=B4L834_DROMO|nr:uncharacterized protein Dmoj_GI10997 [Drosophila mojavensis]
MREAVGRGCAEADAFKSNRLTEDGAVQCARGAQVSQAARQIDGQTLLGGGSVVRRNARERNRVKQVNNGFSQLRQHIPVAIIADLSNGRRGIGPGANKKLSKVSTLRMAVEYIRRLQRVIDDNDRQHKQQQQQLLLPQQQQQQQHQPQQQQQFAQQQQHFNYQQQQLQQQQQQLYALQQQLQLISPSSSTCSSSAGSTSSSSFDSSYFACAPAQLKQEETSAGGYEDYPNNSCSSGAEDDDILDYISLWQDDM